MSCAFLLVVPVFASADDLAVRNKSQSATSESARNTEAVLWRQPDDLSARDVYWGAGGQKHAPHSASYTFLEEDRDGSNPKYVVRDGDGVKWKIKLGAETKPETAAARIMWAAGYFADEDYFLSEVRVSELPSDLRRGRSLIGPGGVMHDVRLKREDGKKEDIWKWKESPFAGTHEFNGLRALLAVINDWDLKDVNNAIFVHKDGERVYMVRDLGATFGTNGSGLSHEKTRGNLRSYTHSRFITKTNGSTVNFATPGRPSLFAILIPWEFFPRWRMQWIGRNIPREDARWMGRLLARLSPKQISDAFRAAGFSDSEVAGFTSLMRSRIDELNRL